MCPDQSYNNNGKSKSNCKNGDFCNLCHSRYEFYYHKLLFGKAMTCLRKKKNGKCIFEETCYGYHPYMEPGYKKTKEEIIQEKKDALLDKYTEEYNLLNELISQYKCQKCEKFNKKFKFYLLINCNHIICHKCFKEKALDKKKCLICKRKFDPSEEKKEFIEIDFKQSAMNIDELIKKNYEEKSKEKQKNEINEENDRKEEKKNEKDTENQDNSKKEEKGEKTNEKSESDDGKDNNNSMG